MPENPRGLGGFWTDPLKPLKLRSPIQALKPETS